MIMASSKDSLLPALEVNCYVVCWTLAVLYSSYQIHIAGNREDILQASQKSLETGWFSGSKLLKDNGDLEWSVWIRFICQFLLPSLIIHYFGACLIRAFNPKFLPLWYFVITSSCLISLYGVHSYLILVLQPMLFAFALHLRKCTILISLLSCAMFYLSFHSDVYSVLKVKTISVGRMFSGIALFPDVLIYFLVFTLTSCIRKSSLIVWMIFGFLCYMFVYREIIPVSSTKLFMLIPCMMWIYLKCLSFCLEEFDEVLTLESVYLFLGYTFHLPCFFMGPIILYQPFKKQLFSNFKIDIKRFLPALLINNARYFFWMIVMEFLLHFIHINCLTKNIQYFVVDENSVWIMFGIGFHMGLFFFLKYTVVYGLSITWTRAEGYETPNPPKCIGWIAMYSDMWRLFDEGLYLFIQRYIHTPLSNYVSLKILSSYSHDRYSILMSKVISSLFCFIFVFLWHGLEYWVFIWSFLNFVGILVEKLARELSRTCLFLRLKDSIGPRYEQRLVALFGAPLTILSAVSNFYFLGGNHVAETYFSYLFHKDSLMNTAYLWFFVYCLWHVSKQYKDENNIIRT